MMDTKELLKIEENHTLSFGDYTLDKKTKVEDFEFQGDLYKVKTFADITKLEKNGMFVYESVPGTKVKNYNVQESQVSFDVFGDRDAQVTLELEPSQSYFIRKNGEDVGEMSTNVSGKLSISVELSVGTAVEVVVTKL